MKMKDRQEILENSLSHSFKECKSFKEKRVFKKLACNEGVRKKKGVSLVSKLLGLRGPVRATKHAPKNNFIKEEMERFYLQDNISRCTAGKKECKTYKKTKHQIRYLTDTLMNLFTIYKEEGGKYNLSTFIKYKPFYVCSPKVQNRETCMCIKHSNMDMLFSALKKNGLIHNTTKNMTDILTALTCDRNSYNCM
jgi:hypothetical protein